MRLDRLIKPQRGYIIIAKNIVIPYDPIGVEPKNKLIFYAHLIPLGLIK